MIQDLLIIKNEGERYYRFANADGKQWIMPARNLRTAMELYQPSGKKGIMLKKWFPLLHRIAVVRRIIHIETLQCLLNDELRHILEKAFNTTGIEVAIFFGTPSVHQKTTIQISKGNIILGYCKLSDNEEIAELFIKEAQLLHTLHKKGLKNIPECHFCGNLSDGTKLFVQSTAKTLDSKVVHEWGEIHLRFLSKMRDATIQTLRFEDTDYFHTVEALTEHYDWLPDFVDKTLVEKAIRELYKRWQGMDVAFSAYHADFTPWNMFVEKGELFVFDWEYAKMTYPPMLDRYHFFTQTAIFERHWHLEDIIRYINSDNGKWINTDSYKAYLIEIIARFTLREQGNVDGDIAKSMKLWNSLLSFLIPNLKKMKRIICFHLYNDFSGSPIVLRMVLEGLLRKGFKVDLVTSNGGVLDELVGMDGLTKHSYFYRFSNNSAMTMARYAAVQIYTFFLAFRWIFNRDVVFYINTLLPVGPALAGRIMGKRVVYHYHENAFIKGVFYKTLSWVMQRLAHEIMCVSEYQASSLADRSKVRVIPNALPKAFVEKLKPDTERAFRQKNILMLASLKAYKGTKEFIELSARMPEYRFTLVLNDSQENIDDYISANSLQKTIGANLTIFPRQNDVTPFYNKASLLLNLSDKNRIIETFGMTVLEAMSAALPVIVPTEGGVAEMVDDGVNGYKIDVSEMDKIEKRIREMLSDIDIYRKMSHNAITRAQLYDSDNMTEKIANTIRLFYGY